MNIINKIKCLDALTLKVLAMILMLLDHMWATVIPGNQWMTCIGRLAFPIFAFQIVEGFFKTSNFKRYLSRMFLFACISEIPFNLMMNGSWYYPFHQNVLFTFCIALILIRVLEWAKSKNIIVYTSMGVLMTFVGYMIGMITMVDYYGFGILMCLVFYFCYGLKYGWIGQFIGLAYINIYMMQGLEFEILLWGHRYFIPQQAFALLALIPIWIYNGKQGYHNRFIQWACYAFYPVHILILSLLWMF